MGVFKVRVEVFSLQNPDASEEVEMTVDTGATYPVVPKAVAESLGIGPAERRTFTLADGREISRELGWAGISYDGRRSPCLVILGEESDIPLLGAFALEGLGLEADPVSRSLRPATQYLLFFTRP